MSNKFFDFFKDQQFQLDLTEEDKEGGLGLWMGLTDEQARDVQFQEGKRHSIGGVIQRTREITGAKKDLSQGMVNPEDADPRLGIKESLPKVEYDLRLDRYKKQELSNRLLTQYFSKKDPTAMQQLAMFGSGILGSTWSLEDLAVAFIPYEGIMHKALKLGVSARAAAKFASLSGGRALALQGGIAGVENYVIGKFDQSVSRQYGEEYTDAEVLADAVFGAALGVGFGGIALPLMGKGLAKTVDITGKGLDVTARKAAEILPDGEFKDRANDFFLEQDIYKNMMKHMESNPDIKASMDINNQNYDENSLRLLRVATAKSMLEGVNFDRAWEQVSSMDQRYQLSTLNKVDIERIKSGDFGTDEASMLRLQLTEPDRYSVSMPIDNGILGHFEFVDIRNADLSEVKKAISDMYISAFDPTVRDSIIEDYNRKVTKLSTAVDMLDRPNPNISEVRNLINEATGLKLKASKSAGQRFRETASSKLNIYQTALDNIMEANNRQVNLNQEMQNLFESELAAEKITKAKVENLTSSDIAVSKKRRVDSIKTRIKFMFNAFDKDVLRQRGTATSVEKTDAISVLKEMEGTTLDEAVVSILSKEGVPAESIQGQLDLFKSNLSRRLQEGKATLDNVTVDGIKAVLNNKKTPNLLETNKVLPSIVEAVKDSLGVVRAESVKLGNPIKKYTSGIDVELRKVEKALNIKNFEALSNRLDEAFDIMKRVISDISAVETKLGNPNLTNKDALKRLKKEYNYLINDEFEVLKKRQFNELNKGLLKEDSSGLAGDVFRIKSFLVDELEFPDAQVNTIFNGYKAVLKGTGVESTGQLDNLFSQLDSIGKQLEDVGTDVDVNASIANLKNKLKSVEGSSMFTNFLVDHYEDLLQKQHLLLQEKLNVLNNFYRLARDKSTFGNNKEEALKSLITNSLFDAEGARYNFENMMVSVENELLSTWYNKLNEAGLTKFFTSADKEHTGKFREALLYLDSPDGLNKPSPEYIKAAELYQDLVLRRNQMLNDVGSNLKGYGKIFRLDPEKLTDYVYMKYSQQPNTAWNNIKLGTDELIKGPSVRELRYKKAKEYLWLEVFPKLNLIDTFHVKGIYDVNSMRRYFDNLLDSYTQGTVFYKKNGPELMLKDTNERLVFKNKKDYIEFINEYGFDSMAEQVMYDTRKAARTYTALKMFGPNIRDTYNAIYEATVDFYGKDTFNPRHQRRMNHVINVLDGTSDVPENMAIATLFGGVRALDMRKLWSTTIKSGSDLVNNMSALSNAFGLVNDEGLKARWGEFYTFAGNPLDKEAGERMASKLGLATNIFSYNIMETYSVGRAAAKKVRQAQDWFMAANGLRWFTNSQQRAVTGIASVELNDMIRGMKAATRKNYNKLPDSAEHSYRFMKQYGIRVDRNEHKLLAEAAFISRREMEDFVERDMSGFISDDMAFLSPLQVREMSPEKFSELVKKYHNHIEPDKKIRFDYRLDDNGKLRNPEDFRVYRDELANKLGAMLSDIGDEAITKPRALTMSYMKHLFGETKAGTWGGELMRTAMLFKSFPVARMIQDFGRVLNKGRDPLRHKRLRDWILSPEFFNPSRGPVVDLVGFMSAVMFMEYLGVVASNYALGMTPEKHDLKFFLNLVDRTSAFGPYGEIALNFLAPSEYDRTRGFYSKLAGPAIGGWVNTWSKFGNSIYNDEEAGMKLVEDSLKGLTEDPMWKVPFAHVPIRMMFMDPLAEWIDPSFKYDRYRKYKEKEQDLLWDNL